MKTVEMIYPLVRFNTLTVEVTDEQADELENANQEDKAKFIYKQHVLQTDNEISNQKLIEEAMDWEYAKLKVLD